jgi:hypothetical protein
MRYELSLDKISDDDLLSRLGSLLRSSRGAEADLVAQIAEVDARQLYLREACPSMHVYCTTVLHLSDPEAYLRITVGRAARTYPVILEMLSDGRLHLSAISRLSPYLTAENHAEVLARAVHKSRREVEDLVAELAPRPDVATVVRKLPTKMQAAALGLDPRETIPVASDSGPELRPDRVASSVASSPPARVEVLAPARYKVQFTANLAFRDKLERLQALMRSKFPDGDLAKILEEAVTEKLARVEARRFAKTPRPRQKTIPKDDGSRRVPAALKRAVNLRDEGQCRFVDDLGRRCPERHRLEYHHRDPYGLGGERTLANVCLMCDRHNQYLADRDYGKGKMDEHRTTRRVGRIHSLQTG